MTLIELYHPTDPRFLLFEDVPPERIKPDDLFSGVYGRPLIYGSFFGEVDLVYAQPEGPGTDWVKP